MKRTHRCYKMSYISHTNGQILIILSSNANKFQLLRYGKEEKIKSATTCKSYDDSKIDDKEQVRDLGIMMSNTASFTLHIRNIDKKARDKMGCVMRVFQSRKPSLMLTLLKSLVIPLLEYCCQLWNPWEAKDIQAIELNERLHTKSLKYSI